MSAGQPIIKEHGGFASTNCAGGKRKMNILRLRQNVIDEEEIISMQIIVDSSLCDVDLI